MNNSKNNRLEEPYGLYINRSKQISFYFNSNLYTGYQGDTIASALAANGVFLLSRSFKYHRPRGILTMAGRDANTLVQVDDEPNVRADVYLVREGLHVWAQNVFGSLSNDKGQIIEKFARFLPVGFYYKAFYKPKGAWKYWDSVIRKIAGLGKVDTASIPYKSDKAYRFCDIAVIGAGPAGLSAALQAAQAGATVILIDENSSLGGSLNYTRVDQQYSCEQLIEDVVNHPAIEIYFNATCTGWFADNWLSVMCPARMLKLRAKIIIAATGLIEQPAVFRNNDLPGVMLGSAAQRLIRLYGVAPGRSAIVLTSNEDGYSVALDLIDVGITVNAIVDMHKEEKETELVAEVKRKNIAILQGNAIYEAIPGPGKRSITGALVGEISKDGSVDKKLVKISCDLICMCAGYTPAAQLLCHSGGTLKYDELDATLKIKNLPSNALAAGSVNNIDKLDAVLADGKVAGWRAAKKIGFYLDEEPSVSENRCIRKQNYPFPIFSHAKKKEFVDFDEDLQIGDIKNAIKEGYDDVELVKRYSTVVMGPSQGRQSALNNMRLVARYSQQPQVNTITTQRPPYSPEYIQHLAGKSYQPIKRTAIHYRHIEKGAQMMPAGVWLRPAYYGEPTQKSECINRESLAVHNNVGLIDVSTLGKLEIRGPDAAELLNRMYTFTYSKQAVNRSRYVLMTDQFGAITDDGVACRLGEQHFYVTATTSGVDNVFRNMLHWNAQWCLDVDITNVTAAYAAVNIAGPNSRNVLNEVVDDINLDANAFSYMEVKTGHVAKIPARILRVGFVGELGYEIHVPAHQGEALWDALMQAGEKYKISVFGVEAQRLLRLEKGHIIVGQDTDGLTIPPEADMAWAMAKTKPFYIGKRPIEVLTNRGLTRKLVGFEMPSDATLPLECNLIVEGNEITGRVTSVSRSPILEKTIGLAFVQLNQSEIGTNIQIKLTNSKIVNAVIVPTPFYDPHNKRQEM